MITLAPVITITTPPISFSKSTEVAWRVVCDREIIEGLPNSATYCLCPILEVPLHMFTAETTIPEARAFLHALIGLGGLEQSEIDAIHTIFPE